MQTARQRRGAAGEDLAAAYLAELGWTIVARNLKVGHDEIDIVAIDPGPDELVCVEVRSASSKAFGPPEERVDRRKVARLYRAMAVVGAGAADLPPVRGRAARRVDLLIVDRRQHPLAIRHMRHLEPP